MLSGNSESTGEGGWRWGAGKGEQCKNRNIWGEAGPETEVRIRKKDGEGQGGSEATRKRKCL